MKNDFTNIYNSYKHLLESPLDTTKIIIGHDGNLIALAISTESYLRMGGSTLDDRVMLSGKYGKIIRAKFANDK